MIGSGASCIASMLSCTHCLCASVNNAFPLVWPKKKTTKTLGLRGTQKVGTVTDEAGELKADEDEDEKEVAPIGKAKDSVSNDDERGEEKEENDESDDGDADKKEKSDDGNADSNDNAIATKKKNE